MTMIHTFLFSVLFISCWANPWIEKTSSLNPTARYYHAAATANDNLYIFGGLIGPVDGQYKAVGDMWKWNNHTGWTEIQLSGAVPEARAYATLTTVDSTHLLLFGGQKQKYPSYMGDTWMFDITTETWTEQKPAASPQARSYHAASFSDGAVWIFGGAMLTSGTVSNDVWAYNVSLGNWMKIFPAVAGSAMYPAPRQGPQMVTAGSSTLILYGGRGGELTEGGYNDVWTLDTRTRNWTSIQTRTPGPKRFAFSMVWSQSMYAAFVFGGAFIDPPKPDQFYDDVWQLEPSGFGVNQVWNFTQVLPNDQAPTAGTPWKRKGQSADLITDTAFVMFGGYGLYQGLKDDTWTYHFL